jgi:hypothetical protein
MASRSSDNEHLLTNLGAEDFTIQRRLVAEVITDGGQVDVGLACQLAHRGCLETLLGEQPKTRAQQPAPGVAVRPGARLGPGRWRARRRADVGLWIAHERWIPVLPAGRAILAIQTIVLSQTND